MKLKKTLLGCALLGTFTGACILGGCGEKEIKIIPTDEKYVPNFTVQKNLHAIDEEVTLDGILDEDLWKKDGGTQRWYRGKKQYGSEWANIDFTSWFGDEGIYFAFEVTEAPGTIFYNSARESFMNSGIEMYLALEGTTTIDSNTSFEIDMQCSGELKVKQRFQNWTDVSTVDEITPQYRATVKNGAINSATCDGYIGELFLPYDFFVHLELIDEGEKINEVYVNPVLITSYSQTDTNTNTGRHWYNTCDHDTDGSGWNNPQENFHFNKDGLISHDITINANAGGSVSAPKGYNFAIDKNSLTLNISADDGYTLKKLSLNGENMMGKIQFDNDGSAYLYLPSVTQDLTVDAEFAAVSPETRVVEGNITADNCPEAIANMSDIQARYFDGFKYTPLRTTNGHFRGSVPVDGFDLVLYSLSGGYVITSHSVEAGSEDIAYDFVIDQTMYGSKRTVSDSGTVIYSGNKTVNLSGTVTAKGMVASFWYGLPGPGNIGEDITSDAGGHYVSNFYIMADSSTYVRLQIVKWGGYSIKALIPSQSEQAIVLTGEVLNKLIQDNGLHLYIEGGDKEWTVYADIDGKAVSLGKFTVGTIFNSSKITQYRVEAAEGVCNNWGVKVSDIVFYQDTTLDKVLKG